MPRRLPVFLLLPASLIPTGVAAVPADAATSGCAGRTVARADIDGDARRDTVTVTRLRAGDQPVHRLCVATAAGRVSAIVDTAEWMFYSDPVLYGVAGMDGSKGNEIILRSGYGAHSQRFHVYRWTSGRLVRQNAPDTRTPAWVIDVAASTIKGYRFSTVRGTRYLVSSYGTKRPLKSTYSVTRTTYRWSKGAWQRVGTSKASFRDDSAAAMNTLGWHGISVPRGY